MSGPLFIYRTSVSSNWIDYNGHMGDYAYGIVFSDAATAYMDRIGIDATYREANNATLYTLDSRIGYLKECHVGEALSVDLTVLDADRKRMHLFMRILNEGGQDVALCEQVLMHVSRTSGAPRASDMPELSQERLFADLELSRAAIKPDWLTRQLGLKTK
ncbi:MULTISPECIES: thioesterase family protein [unclassified Ochrobactrum]|uniref:thioesterase family protein n=1 Tax=unclassified Ochrobactrum TaxID=239106 RepID=UPI0015F7DC54|nr:acyl-CoA thioester hydrolase [Ochrobactrum sp. RH2CCR150]MDH7787172.1 acyl-CoA thioester hydrolase [Ochrobactrum sp. 19YEA23]